jgi:hypothetical protein
MKHSPPTKIGDTPVEVVGRPLKVKGRTWHTLIALDESDLRIWEWCSDTGHVIQTVQEEDC